MNLWVIQMIKNCIIITLFLYCFFLSVCNYRLTEELNKTTYHVLKAFQFVAQYDSKTAEYIINNIESIKKIDISDHGILIEHKKEWR